MTGSTTLSSVALGSRELELGEFELPEVEQSSGLLKVEATGVCGSDVKKYSRDPLVPTILGHEIVGVIDDAGSTAARRWGVDVGTRVLLEEYLPCGHCRACRSGLFRACLQTEINVAGAIRYGSTPTSVAPGIWGGYSQYMYLHENTVFHVVPETVSSDHATFALPLSNGIEWIRHRGQVKPRDVVVIQGPGQQGLGCLIAARAAGATSVVVAGLERDKSRLQLALRLGADRVVDIDSTSLADTVLEVSQGRGADVVIDVTGAGAPALQMAIDITRRGGRIVLASGTSGATKGSVDITAIRKRELAVVGARGHSFDSVETALELLEEGSIPMEAICAPPFSLPEVGSALELTAGERQSDWIHAVVAPWADGSTPN